MRFSGLLTFTSRKYTEKYKPFFALVRWRIAKRDCGEETETEFLRLWMYNLANVMSPPPSSDFLARAARGLSTAPVP